MGTDEAAVEHLTALADDVLAGATRIRGEWVMGPDAATWVASVERLAVLFQEAVKAQRVQLTQSLGDLQCRLNEVDGVTPCQPT